MKVKSVSAAHSAHMKARDDDDQQRLLSKTQSNPSHENTEDDQHSEGDERSDPIPNVYGPRRGVRFNTDEEEDKSAIGIDVPSEQMDLSPEILPPKDRGWVAWRVLLACLFLESATFGVPLSFGIFQEFYSNKFHGNNNASWIGVLSNGIPFLGAPLITHLCQKYTFSRKWYILIGFTICLVSLLASAFTPTLDGLIFTQGVLYGIGALLVDLTQLIILNTWFDERRGLAYGLVFGGADFFGVVYTFIAQVLLGKIGLKYTMLIFAGILVAVAGPSIFVLHERPEEPKTPVTPPAPPKRSTTMSRLGLNSVNTISSADLPFTPYLKRRNAWPIGRPMKRYYQRALFYLFNLANFLHASAYYLPFIYLPSFVVDLGHSQNIGAIVLAIANLAQVLGDIGFGKLSDKLHVNYLIALSTFASSFATFVLWGVFGSGRQALGVLIAYGILFGGFGAGFLGIWARMGTLFGDEDAQMVYASLSFGRGTAAILSGPISQGLVMGPGLSVFGGRYGDVIAFTGSCMAGGGLMGIGAIFALRWNKHMNGGSTTSQTSQQTLSP